MYDIPPSVDKLSPWTSWGNWNRTCFLCFGSGKKLTRGLQRTEIYSIYCCCSFSYIDNLHLDFYYIQHVHRSKPIHIDEQHLDNCNIKECKSEDCDVLIDLLASVEKGLDQGIWINVFIQFHARGLNEWHQSFCQ